MLGNLNAETVPLMRYLLGELAGHRELNALIEKESAQYRSLAQRFWHEIAEPGCPCKRFSKRQISAP